MDKKEKREQINLDKVKYVYVITCRYGYEDWELLEAYATQKEADVRVKQLTDEKKLRADPNEQGYYYSDKVQFIPTKLTTEKDE